MAHFLGDAPVVASDLKRLDTKLSNDASTRVNTAVANLVDSAPETLDTLAELAQALNNDADFATTMTTQLANKQDAFSVQAGLTLSGGVLSANTIIDYSNPLSASLIGSSANTVSDAEYAHLAGVSSSIQGQLDQKATAFTVGAGLTLNGTLTADVTQSELDTKQDVISASSRLDASLVANGSISNAEFQHLNSISSNIQQQINGRQPTISAGTGLAFAGTTLNADVSTADLAAKHDLISASNRLDAGLIGDGSVSSAELSYVNGASANLQSQINGLQASITAGDGLSFSGDTLHAEVTQTELNEKQNAIIGAATTLTDTNLASNRALVSNGNGKVAVSAVTLTELGHLGNVASNLQAQLDALKPQWLRVVKHNKVCNVNTWSTIDWAHTETKRTVGLTAMSHSISSNNDKVYIDRTGIYRLNFVTRVTFNARHILRILLNGSQIGTPDGRPYDIDMDTSRTCTGTVCVYALDSQYIQIQAYFSSQSETADFYMDIEWVGEKA